MKSTNLYIYYMLKSKKIHMFDENREASDDA